MKNTSKKEHLLLNKIFFLIGTLVIYLIGKNLPLFMIDEAAYSAEVISAEEMLLQAIRGDRYQYSLFALGISPHMIAGIITQMIMAFKSSEAKARTSPMKMGRFTMFLALLLSVFMALGQTAELHFKVSGKMLMTAQLIAAVEMVAGAMLIVWLCDRNKKYGIGGQSAIILVNLIDSFYNGLKGHETQEMLMAVLLIGMSVVVMAILENSEKRIPLQRVSIHNIYADKNYLAIKMNPIGVMPAMFSMAVFMLMQMILGVFGLFFATHPVYLWWEENLVLTKPLGIAMYVVGLYILSIGFSRVFLNPKETTEQFLKTGDSIQNIHAGKDTKKYLSRTITGLAFFSATMMAFCLAFPLVLQMQGELKEGLAALPSSAMMLTGIICSLIREIIAVRHLEGYKPFI